MISLILIPSHSQAAHCYCSKVLWGKLECIHESDSCEESKKAVKSYAEDVCPGGFVEVNGCDKRRGKEKAKVKCSVQACWK